MRCVIIIMTCWFALALVVSSIVGRYIRRAVHEAEKRERLAIWRECERLRKIAVAEGGW